MSNKQKQGIGSSTGQRRRVVIVGAGPVGTLAALFLARLGHRVQVFDQRDGDGDGDGLHCASMLLSKRGMQALDQLGLIGQIQPELVPLKGRMVHDLKGHSLFYSFGKQQSNLVYSISRERLQLLLVNALKASGLDVSFHYNCRCSRVDLRQGAVVFEHLHRHSSQTVYFDHLIGADGAHSAVRPWVIKAAFGRSRLTPLGHGYKQMTLPPRSEGTPALKYDALHLWPRRDHMMVALPNSDCSFTISLFMPLEGQNSFSALTNAEERLNFFQTHYSSLAPLPLDWLEQFEQSPLGRLDTLRCQPWHYQDKALLIGDAAHAMVPFHGQGLNCGFEDCLILDRLLRQNAADSWRQVFASFAKLRVNDCQAISDMALENYQQIRLGLLDPSYKFKNDVEQMLEHRFSPYYQSRYRMVMLEDVPYMKALKQGRVNAEIIRLITEGKHGLDQIDWDYAKNLLHREGLLPTEWLSAYNFTEA